MIYKYTKCESVIAKILADLDSSESKNRISDIREWIFEAVDKIGAPMQYIQKESGVDTPLLKIQDKQVPLPDDLVVLDGAAYATGKNGPWVPMRKETSTIKNFNTHPVHNKHFIPNNDDIEVQKLPTSQSQFYTVNGMKYLDKAIAKNVYKTPTYFIKPGWVVTNQSDGYVKLSYKAIATDERGYPLIPDLTSYQEAIYWYVTMKLTFPKFLKGKLGGKSVRDNRQVYTYIQQQWNFYRNQAYAEAMMPTQDDMRAIKNDWLKLIPDVDADDFFFGPTGDRETTYNDYYYGY